VESDARARICAQIAEGDHDAWPDSRP